MHSYRKIAGRVVNWLGGKRGGWILLSPSSESSAR